MRVVKFLEEKTLRVKKRICLVGVRDNGLVVLHEEWYAETFVRPGYLLSLLFSPWKVVKRVDRECGETLKEIERKYGRVRCTTGFSNERSRMSINEFDVSSKSIKESLEQLLAVLDLREEWKLDKACGTEK